MEMIFTQNVYDPENTHTDTHTVIATAMSKLEIKEIQNTFVIIFVFVSDTCKLCKVIANIL